MNESAPAERCGCHEAHPTPDGRCVNPPLRSESPDLSGYSECGCCVADCPDVHPDSERKLTAVPGSAVIAEEYVATLPAEKQKALRDQEARGELRIAPRSEMRLPGRD